MRGNLLHKKNARTRRLVFASVAFFAAVFANAVVSLAAAPEESSGSELRRFEFSAEKMGVPLRVLLYARDAETASEAVDAVWKRFDDLNDALSDYDPESETTRACREAGETGAYVAVGADLRRALEESRKYCLLTGGAFDATVGPVVKLWRRSRSFHKTPPESALGPAKANVGLDVWEISPEGVRMNKGVRFDFGGIAKGMALDDALEILKERGIESALVDASGDLRIGAPPPDKNGWRVGVASLGDEPAFCAEVANVGIASSGDANRFVEIDGVRYSHIIDPRSREPLTRRCVAAVMAPTATTADALASALCVLGGEEAPEVFERIRAEGVDGDKRALEPFEYVLIQVDSDAEPPYDEGNTSVVATEGFQRELDAAKQ